MIRKVALPARMDILKALATSPKVPDHVLPGLPTGTVGALISAGGVGKTMLLLQASVSLATGRPILGGLFGTETAPAAAPAKVVIVVAEEGVDVMHLRLHAVVARLLNQTHTLLERESRDRLYELLSVNLHLYPLAGAAHLCIDRPDGSGAGLAVLSEMAVGARLLVIDPLRQFHSGDENDSWAMTSVVQGLQGVATARSCAILVAHHANKAATFNGQADRAGASRGSAAFTDGVRCQMNLSPLDEGLGAAYGISGDALPQHVRLDLAKANYVPPQAPQVLRREAGGVFELTKKPAGRAPARAGAKSRRSP